MRFARLATIALMFCLTLTIQSFAAQFVLFPRAERLASPNGRYQVRDADRPGSASDFVGEFHSLWLTDLSKGTSRKICDYMGVAAVAWSGNDFLVVTQYVGKKTSRALLFAADGSPDPVMIDKSTLIQFLPVGLRDTLRENDHVFVEGTRLEKDTFFFRVWGYGQHDPNGFRWNCQSSLREGNLTCAAATETTLAR